MSFSVLSLLFLLFLGDQRSVDWFDGSTLTVVVPDAVRSRERWQVSPYARMAEALADEEIGRFAGIAWQEGLAQLQELTWIDPLPLLDDLRQWCFNAVISGDDEPEIHTMVRLASRAKEVFAAVAAQPGGNLSEDGLQIICHAGSVTARDGDALSYHVPGQTLPDYDPTLALFADEDIGISVVLSPADDLDDEAQARRRRFLGADGDLHLRLGMAIGEHGTRLRLRAPDRRLTGPLAPIDRNFVAPLPANTLAVMAVGIDMPLLIERLLEDGAGRWFLSGLVDQEVTDVQSLRTALGQDQESGPTTVLVAVNPGLPIPHVSIGLPSDAVIDAMLANIGIDVAAAQRAPVRIDEGPRPMHLRRGPRGWGISTSPALAELLAQGGRDSFWSGRLASEMAVGDNDHLILGIDARQALTMAGAMMRVAVGLAGDDVPGELRLLAPAVNAIAPHARHVVLRFGHDENGTHLTAYNVVPIGLGLMALGWSVQSRHQAPGAIVDPPGLMDFDLE